MLDAKTTPPRLRIPALILVGLMGSYFSMCMALEFIEGPGKAKTLVGARTFGQWNMFTLKASWNKQLKAQVYRDGEWTSVDLPKMYKARWESGPRYQRPAFLRKTSLTPLLAQSICARSEPQPLGVRLYRVRWKRKLGVAQTPDKPEVSQLLEWPCKRKIPAPKGVVL